MYYILFNGHCQLSTKKVGLFDYFCVIYEYFWAS